VVTPLKTLMGFSVHLNVQLKFYNLPKFVNPFSFTEENDRLLTKYRLGNKNNADYMDIGCHLD
ncbi:hypothetical protein QUW44_09180, partial [Limosilactobacillus pontis]|nr:hypothetical protein [Limosilactobacillus pontis]